MALVHLHADDNVAIASRDLAMDERVRFEQGDVIVLGPVGLGHKVAVRPIASGEPVIKFGQWIGFAKEPIATGCWVHSYNLEAGQFARGSCSRPGDTGGGP
jgi:altronate hydrolase